MCRDMHRELLTGEAQALVLSHVDMGLSHVDMVDHLCDSLLSPAPPDVKLITMWPKVPTINRIVSIDSVMAQGPQINKDTLIK